MKAGTENRNKTILAGVLGAAALCGVVWVLWSELGPSPAPSHPVVATPATGPAPATRANNSTGARELLNDSGSRTGASESTRGPQGLGAVPGVAAQRVASTSSSLDPTLDESAMLRTESLVYSGTGRNIFSLTYTPPVAIPTAVPKVRQKPTAYVPPPPPPPPPTCPPSCPPIPLKFFGTATRGSVRQAFLLSGEDVYLASQGDIVARRYKVGAISATTVQVEDLTNHFTQMLPLSMQ